MDTLPEEPRNPLSETKPSARGNSLEVAFDACPTPLLILETGKMCILEANPAAAELLGVPGGDLIGEQFQLFFPNEAAMDEFVRLLPDFDPTSRQSAESRGRLQMRRRDGTMIYVEARAATCRLVGGHPGFAVSLRGGAGDAADAESAINSSQARVYKHLIESIGEGFLVLNDAGLTSYANPSAARLLGLAPAFMVGRKLHDLFPQLYKEDLARFSNTPSREPQPHPVRIPVFLGCDLHQFELVVHPYDDGHVVLFRDVSERVKQEVEIAKLNATMAVSQQLLRSKNEELNDSLEKLAQLNEQLANADRLKSDFLANTSHELRTPLNSIIGFLQLISEGLCENPEEEREYVRNALVSGQHLLSLINDVLDIAKIEAGKMTLLIDDIDLDTVFHEVFSLTHIQAQQKKLRLTFEIHGDSHRIVRADFHKVKQVLINLVGNAIKFTSAGYIRVWAEPSIDQADTMLVSVQDSGIGVPLNQQQSVFEKFVQVDGTSTRKYQGSGLGLAISKNLVEMMGGTIGIFSEGIGSGSRMFFTLPISSFNHGGGMLEDMDIAGSLENSF